MGHYSERVNFDHYDRVELEGKMVWLPRPVQIPKVNIIERQGLIDRALAAWLCIDGLPPLNFRLYGPPGSGKNTLIYNLSRFLNKDLYILNGHQELGPEDISCTATMTSNQTIEYVASPLVAAALKGGICFFDEIAKAPVAALDPLASVLDDRRTITSVLAGLHIMAHPDFLFCAALNQDEEEGLGLPGFLEERTRPAIRVDVPSTRVLETILRAHLPQAADTWFKEFLKEYNNDLSPRGAIILLEYAYRLSKQEGNKEPAPKQIHGYLRRASESVAMKKENREVS